MTAPCNGPCASCGTLAPRVEALEVAKLALEGEIAKLKSRGIVRRLGVRELMARLGIEARTTIARMVARGDLPEPDRLPGGRRVWRLDAIEEWEKARAAAPHQTPRGIAAQKAAEKAQKIGGAR